ncbi:uncharacterized protein LOC135943420 [Cloeon dipterum]|uniref:uncharacterized protein LOC135943420 n=1 Tax=Cloeon dipterum TaxID=197152 RepID=UPI00321FE67A
MFSKAGCKVCPYTVNLDGNSKASDQLRDHRSRCKDAIPQNRYDCVYCSNDLKYTEEGSLHEHVFNTELACNICKTNFKGCKALGQHKQEKHKENWSQSFGVEVLSYELEDTGEEEVQEMCAVYSASGVMEAIPNALFDLLLSRVVSSKENETQLKMTTVHSFISKPTEKQEVVVGDQINLLYLPCRLHQDVLTIILINLEQQSVHYFNPKYKLISSTITKIERILAGLYISMERPFKQGGSKLVEYEMDIEDQIASPELYLLLYCYNVGRRKPIGVGLKNLIKFKKMLLK